MTEPDTIRPAGVGPADPVASQVQNSEPERWDFAGTFRPSLWQRICWWHRWPWRPRAVHPIDHRWDAPWITVVRQNGTIIGWHCDDIRPTAYVVRLDRWAHLYGLVTGRLVFEVETIPGKRVPAR